MSTDESSLDPNLIEQTKHQIRSLVNEIAQLSKSEMGPQEYYGEFLNRVVSALAAIGGVVWTMEQGRLGITYQNKLHESRLPEKSEEEQIQHGRLLQKVMSSGDGLLVPPHSGAVNGEQGANPTEFLLVLGPLKTELETVGVVEVFQRPDAPMGAQKGYLRFLLQMCELAGDYLKSRQLRTFSDRQVLWSQLEEFARAVHASLDPRDTAYTIANEGRRLIECDRVSVAIRKGRKCTIEAVSGQDLFDKRSNTVRLLGRLATAVVDSDEPMWYTGDTSKMAPQVEEAVQEYVDESHSKTVAVLPLRRERPADEEYEVDKPKTPCPPIGALIVEQIEDSRVPEKMLNRVDVVSLHSSAALANALEHQNLFLMPLWRALGKARWVVEARTLPKTLLITGAVVGVILFLCFFPASLEINCKGTLEPVQHQDVFASVDGHITEMPPLTNDNRSVRQGDLLAKMEDTTISMQKADLEGQIKTTEETLFGLIRKRTVRDGAAENRSNDALTIEGQISEAQAKLKSLQHELELCLTKERQLEVRSPMTGLIVTWDLEELMLRPVKRGDVLMRVVNPDGPWELELHMPENQMGYITEAQRAQGEDLQVQYILATEPNKPHRGTLQKVELIAEIRGEEGNTVLMKVGDIDKKDLPFLRPGAAVSAKVYCGKRAIGFVWLHDFFAWVDSKILFRWF